MVTDLELQALENVESVENATPDLGLMRKKTKEEEEAKERKEATGV